MDRLSYKDGYLKGIYQTLNILQKDGVISEKQREDYKDKLFYDEIVVPEKHQFYNRNYLNELKQIAKERDHMQKIVPLIKEIQRKSIYKDYNFRSINEMLVDGVGIAKSTASEILLLSDYYYNMDGSIKPEWKGFAIKSLIFLARRHKEGTKDIFVLRKSNKIRPNMKHSAIEALFCQSMFVDSLWDCLSDL